MNGLCCVLMLLASLETPEEAAMLKQLQQGKLIPHRLPLEGQLAPVQQMLVSDFDRDGKIDLLLLGNDYGMAPETYRQDASNSCLLKGDGKGGFQFVPNKISGIWAKEEVRDAAIVPLPTGKNVLVLVNNSGLTRTFGSN